MTRVLIAGAGVAAVECVLALRAVAGPRADIELLAPAAELVLRPLSVETPFGGRPAPRIALDRLARELGVRLHRDGLASVESEQHRVLTRDGDSVPYEILVVATGARSREAVSGAATFRGPMSAGIVEQAIERVFADPGLRLGFVAPAGARWLLPLYELALLSAAALREGGIAEPDVVVATPEHAPLEALGPAAGEAVRAAARSRRRRPHHQRRRGGRRRGRGAARERRADRRRRRRRAARARRPAHRRPAARRRRLSARRRASARGRHGRRLRGRRRHRLPDQARRPRSPAGRRGRRRDRRPAGQRRSPRALPARVARRADDRRRPALSERRAAGRATVSTEPLWSPPEKLAGRYLARSSPPARPARR